MTQEQIDRINELARKARFAGLTPDEEKERAKKDMGSMLDYIDKLGELDTRGVEPMSHCVSGE